MPFDFAENRPVRSIRFRVAALDLTERARRGEIDAADLHDRLLRLALRDRRRAADLWERYTGGRLAGN